MLAFVRALVNDPAMVLADEPTGNLDDKTALEILEILKGLKNDEKTVVVVAHGARTLASLMNVEPTIMTMF